MCNHVYTKCTPLCVCVLHVSDRVCRTTLVTVFRESANNHGQFQRQERGGLWGICHLCSKYVHKLWHLLTYSLTICMVLYFCSGARTIDSIHIISLREVIRQFEGDRSDMSTCIARMRRHSVRDMWAMNIFICCLLILCLIMLCHCLF
jgi:hypothetical protein